MNMLSKNRNTVPYTSSFLINQNCFLFRQISITDTTAIFHKNVENSNNEFQSCEEEKIEEKSSNDISFILLTKATNTKELFDDIILRRKNGDNKLFNDQDHNEEHYYFIFKRHKFPDQILSISKEEKLNCLFYYSTNMLLCYKGEYSVN